MRAACTNCPVLKGMLFRSLPADQMANIGCIFRPATYRRNQVVFFEGGTAQHVFALHLGLVKMVKSLENGQDRITRILFPGELLGIEALTESYYPVTAVALRDCESCAASKEELLEYFQKNPFISIGMIRFLVSEITRVRTQITDMSFKDARMKISTLLLSLIASETPTPAKPYALTLPFSRQEISEILELSPESVSRALSALKRDQLLDVRARHLVIRDLEGLQAAARR